MKTFVLPLDSLVQRLRAADFEIDAATYYRLQKAIYALGKEYLARPDQLPKLLSPIVAKSEEEQLRFQQVFDRFYQDIQQGNEGNERNERNEGNEGKDLETDFKQAARKRRLWVYPLGGILILLFLILFFRAKPEFKSEHESKPHYQSEYPVTPDVEENETERRPQNFQAEETQEAKAEIIIENGQPELGKGMILRSRYVAPNYEYKWFLNGEKLASKEAEVWAEFQNEGMTEIQLIIYAQPDKEKQVLEVIAENFAGPYTAMSGFAEHTIHFHVRPAGTVPDLADREAEQAKLERKQFLVKLLFFGLYVLLLLGTELYMRWYRFSYYQKAFRNKFIPEKDAPYQLPYDATSQHMEPEAELFDLARAMKHPQVSQLEELDMDATLYETVRSGGYPRLQYSPLEREAEYLILVDQSAPAEMQAGLFFELMRMLRKEGVHLQIYTFNSDPRTCYLPGSRQEIRLESLAQRYGMHRLIMFSKGTYMTAANQQEMAAWIENAFLGFEQRILLTPEPQAVWGKREEILASYFLLLPFNTASQQKLTEAMLDPEHAAFDDLREKVFAQVQESISLEAYDFEKEEDVRAYLGDGLFNWLTAAMLYPQPDWQVIMEVGHALEADSFAGDILVRDKSGNALLTMENLSKLATLPWIQQAEWPEALRKKMLANMAPATAQQASLAIASALESADIEQDSAAWKLREAYRAVTAAKQQPDDAILQKQLRFLYKKSLLDKKQKAAIAEELQLGWAERAWDNIGQQVTRYAIILGLLVLPVVSGIYSFNQVKQHQDKVLVKKYYKPYPLNGNESFDMLKYGCQALEAEEPENAITYFAEFMNYTTNVREIGYWYSALSYLQKGDFNYASKLLTPLARDPQAMYHQEAKALLDDLNSIWHRVWEY